MAMGTTGQPTVLVVDDETAVLKMCKTLLEQAGFSVLTAEGSSEALKICKNHPGDVDLLVTDLILPPPGFSLASGNNEFPHVHGHELAVRALRMRENLRVVLMSGNIEKDLVGYGIKIGSVPFIAKPFESQAIVELVHRTLQSPPLTPEILLKESTDRPKGSDEWFD